MATTSSLDPPAQCDAHHQQITSPQTRNATYEREREEKATTQTVLYTHTHTHHALIFRAALRYLTGVGAAGELAEGWLVEGEGRVATDCSLAGVGAAGELEEGRLV